MNRTQIVQAQSVKGQSKNRVQAIKYIDKRSHELAALSDSIWTFAERSFEEIKSSKLQMEFLRKEGFTIQEHVSGFSTVFIATYGEGKPVIGLYGEYDADPNASNRVVPRKEELGVGKNGHGGGHNLLGVGSIGTALAIKDLIERRKLQCTIRYYGTTAEGELGSKTYLARDGFFDDLDFSLYWHPAPATVASTGPWDALIDLDITMTAKKVNVIQSKTPSPTTTAALELLISQLKELRQKENPGVKFNYIISSSPHSLNETPDTIKMNVRIQCAKQQDANQLFEDIGDALNSVRHQTNVQVESKVVRAMHQFLPNVTAMETVYKNLESLGPISYTEEEVDFVKQLQKHLGNSPDGIHDKLIPFSDQSTPQELYGYASDIGDASWIAPEVYFVVRSLPGVPMHQWPGTIFTGHSIGHKGMIKASKVMALTIVDYLENPALQQRIRDDFEKRRLSYRYRSFLTDGPPRQTKPSFQD